MRMGHRCCGGISLQWSPVLETGNTAAIIEGLLTDGWAAMEPGLRDREYQIMGSYKLVKASAAMEPGLRDREYRSIIAAVDDIEWLQWSPVLETGNTSAAWGSSQTRASLQWSPVLETGNTRARVTELFGFGFAAMEPGLRDREYSWNTQPRGSSG